jgi:hypothetical protein
MAVLVQRMVQPDVSFVLHTRHPLSGDRDTVSMELAPGLGETLASGAPARPSALSRVSRSGRLFCALAVQKRPGFRARSRELMPARQLHLSCRLARACSN